MKLLEYSPKQKACIQYAIEEGRINLWEGSVRSGKTINSLIAFALWVSDAPPGSLLMVGRTSDTLRRNVLEPLMEIVGTRYLRVSYGAGWAQLFGRKIHLLGADNQAAESRIRGLTLAGAYVDEVSIIGANHGREFFQMLLTRLSVKGAKVFGTTNPSSPSHWLLTDYLEKAELVVTREGTVKLPRNAPDGLGVYRYRFTLDDNESLPAEYVDSLKASLSGIFYSRFILGEWIASEGAIFPNFSISTPVVPPSMELEDYTVGIDVGTTNATHAVMLATNRHTRTVHVLGEHVSTDATLTYSQQVEALDAWIRSFGLRVRPVLVVDPSARAFRNEVRRVTGVYPWAANNKVLEGISDMGTLLANNVLQVHEGRSPVLVSEIQGYRWDLKASERGEDKPIKEADHGVDALRYGIQAIKKSWKPWVTVDHTPTPAFQPAWKSHPQMGLF